MPKLYLYPSLAKFYLFPEKPSSPKPCSNYTRLTSSCLQKYANPHNPIIYVHLLKPPTKPLHSLPLLTHSPQQGVTTSTLSLSLYHLPISIFFLNFNLKQPHTTPPYRYALPATANLVTRFSKHLSKPHKLAISLRHKHKLTPISLKPYPCPTKLKINTQPIMCDTQLSYLHIHDYNHL